MANHPIIVQWEVENILSVIGAVGYIKMDLGSGCGLSDHRGEWRNCSGEWAGGGDIFGWGSAGGGGGGGCGGGV